MLELFRTCSEKVWRIKNPTSPLGYRWFSVWVSTLFFPSLYNISILWSRRGGLPLLLPPPRAPKPRGLFHSWSSKCNFTTILVIIIFSSFFQHPLTSILVRFWTPTWSQNPSKIRSGAVFFNVRSCFVRFSGF